MKFTVIIFILLLGLPTQAKLIFTRPYSLDGIPPALHNGDYFIVDRGDVHLKGVAVGPLNGTPMIIAPGYFSSSGYLAELALHFADYGYRVYVFSLRGQGTGALLSYLTDGSQIRDGQFGFDEMVKDKMAIIDHVYDIHKTPIVLSGHSLSGILIRAVSIGPALGNKAHKQDARIRAKYKEKVLYAPILKSPSPSITKASELGIEMTAHQKWRLLKAHFVVTSLAPAFAKFRQSSWVKAIEDFLSQVPFIDKLTKISLKFADIFNSDIFRSSDLEQKNAFESLKTALSENLEKDIVHDLDRMIRQGFLSRKGLDYADAYLNSETISERFPIDLISGSDDTLALKEFNILESRLLGHKHYVVGRSHMEGIIGEQAKVVAKIIHLRTQKKIKERQLQLKAACKNYFL